MRVLSSLLNTYISRVHDQPYAYFHEASFRQRFENGSLPKCLLFAVSAIAVRFSNHPYFSDRIHEASAEYSKQAWASILMDYLMVPNNINLPVIQTISLLAIIDYTGKKKDQESLPPRT